MNLYLREMDRNKKSLIIWTIILASTIFLMMAVYPSIAKESKSIEELFKSMPKALLSAFGLDKLSMSNIFGYYATKGYVFVTLFGSIYSIMLAASMLSKEEGEKTIEFLLCKPITRTEVVTNKLLSCITNIIILNVLTTAMLFISFEIFKIESFSMRIFGLLSIAPLLLHLTFASIGFFMSAIMRKSRSVTSISIGVVLITYFLSIAAYISDELEILKYFTPFEYVNATSIIIGEKMNSTYLLIMLILNIAFIAAAYIIYNRKDIAV
ncbi:ABC transporter permease subunit [Clostridium ganghwense]|uniref:ABC transporter permease subunit n=1 Tax=Clostridium ganghwense TaxID=312089 RepID=A0ABT4CSI1_9CLOT|nr:ABC transporter permease subunit [Clostridium ganghwense]MCY6372020.1 ABC transporter permease subunit [Clostridium ganghwense]